MRNHNKISGQLSLAYFAIVVFCVFFVIILPLLILSFISLIFPVAMRAYYLIFYYACKVYVFLGGVQYKEKNLETLKKHQGPHMIMCNHRSHLDMFLLLAEVNRLRAVANANLFKIPLLGQFMKLGGQFPMGRGNIEMFKESVEEIKKAFRLGDVVLFFPEMTRCMPGTPGVQKFRLTGFQLARENNITIIPVVLARTDEVWPKGKMEAYFHNRVSARSLEPIDPNQFPSSVELSLHIHGLMEKNLLEMTS